MGPLLSRAAIVAAVVYCVAVGMLSLWSPANGLDLYVSYTAGTAARSGTSPYDHAVYLQTWDRLSPPGQLAESRDLPFAYPPSWLPLSMALSLLPWNLALACWKLISAASISGIVLLTLSLVGRDELGGSDRRAVWCFALALSPTIAVLMIGQSSLFIVCLIVLSTSYLTRGHVVASGLALALAGMKPQLAAPYILILLARGELKVLAVAAAGNAAIMAAGLYASGTRLDTYLEAGARWTAQNPPTSEIAVGLATLLGHLTNLNVAAATAIGMLGGTAFVATLAFGDPISGQRGTVAEALPLVLLAAPLGFRCNGYDLVALIPLFAWARARRTPSTLRIAIQVLCLVLIVPRTVLHVLYERLIPGLVPHDAYYLGEVTYRSWVLVLLVPLAFAAWRARLAVSLPHLQSS